jgi:hypothetical protein
LKYFRHEMSGNAVDIYPLVCWHIGAVQSSEKFIRKIIAEVKDNPIARWLYMGDGGECNIVGSKGDVYAQTMPPGEQREALRDLLMPIKDKGLGGLSGNHGDRIYRATGLSWDKVLCDDLGIPFFQTSCFGQIALHTERSGGCAPVSVFATHGAGSGATVAGKVNAGMKPLAFVDADIALSAHSHLCSDAAKKHRVSLNAAESRLDWRVQHPFICGSAYDSRLGYSERLVLDPILPEHFRIEVRARRHSQSSKGERTRTTELSIEGRRINGFGRHMANDGMRRDWEAA